MDEDENGDNVLIRAGPCGNLRLGRGNTWEELFPGFVNKIFVSHGTSIRSIQLMYDVPGATDRVLLKRHGGQGEKFSVVEMQHSERIIKVSGHLSYWIGNVKSLTFVTNCSKYGPYGEENGTPFLYEAQGGIDGFHGRCNDNRLQAIGVLLKTGIRKVRPQPQTQQQQQLEDDDQQSEDEQ